jgi:hypothetical protein
MDGLCPLHFSTKSSIRRFCSYSTSARLTSLNGYINRKGLIK